MNTQQLNDVYYKDFVVSDPATGEAIAADAAPSIEVFEDGGTAAMETATAAERDPGITDGQYTFSLTLSAANGFENGKTYNVHVSAVVGGVTGKAVLDTFVIKPVITYVA